MSRLAIPATVEDAPVASQPILEAVRKSLGSVPNLFRLIALSPAALAGFSAFQGALAKTLDLRTRERIALAVAEANGCDYCLSAHTYLGLNLAKLSEAEIALNRQGASADPKAQAAVAFAAKISRARGHVAAEDVEAVRAAGYTDAQVVEIVALVAENVSPTTSIPSPTPTSTSPSSAPLRPPDPVIAGALAPGPSRSPEHDRISRHRRHPFRARRASRQWGHPCAARPRVRPLHRG